MPPSFARNLAVHLVNAHSEWSILTSNDSPLISDGDKLPPSPDKGKEDGTGFWPVLLIQREQCSRESGNPLRALPKALATPRTLRIDA